MKWLLLLVGVSLFYLWLKSKKQAERRTNEGVKILGPEAIVQCKHCKVHIPLSDANTREGRFYCSSEHLNTIDNQGWLGNATWCASPNFDSRPTANPPDLVVIHHISLPPGGFQKRSCTQFIVDFFQNKIDPTEHPYFAEIADQKVSSHFLISRTGELIQFISTGSRAWHAGVSEFLGRERCNDFSIGIELEGDGETTFEDAQYSALAKLVANLQLTIPNLQFAGHSDIAPERKTDPGVQFNWQKFQTQTGISEENFPYGLRSR